MSGMIVVHNPQPGTLANLKAQAPGFAPSVFLEGRERAGDGGEGMFVWERGDHRAQVAADPNAGVYVSPNSDPTGASGCWVRAEASRGEYRPEWFASFDPSMDDATAAIQAAYRAAVMNGADLYLTGRTYLLARTWVINANISVRGAGPGTILSAKAGFVGTAIVQYGADERTGGPHINTVLKGFRCDPNGQRLDGVIVYKAQNLLVENVYAPNCRFGFFCDGQYDVRILNIRFADCYTSGCTVGYRFVGAEPQSSSFDTFLLENCSSESDATGVYISGTLGNRLSLLGGEIQNSTIAAVHAVGASVAMTGTYIETSSRTVPSLRLERRARAMVDVSVNLAHPSIDHTSTLIASGGVFSGHSWSGFQRIGAYDGEADGFGWGPPNWPGKKQGGFQALRGQVYTDSEGVVWTCTKDGASTGSPSRWCALRGEIRIPLTYDQIRDGGKVWFPQEDFVMTDFEVFVTETFAGDGSITFGDSTNDGCFISSTQGASLRGPAGRRLSARRNLTPAASLAAPGQVRSLTGADVPIANNTVISHLTGAFTAGALTIVIRGYYPLLRHDTTYHITDDTDHDLLAPGGFRQNLSGWSQTTVTGRQSDVALEDALSPRGRIMPRAGSITALAVNLSSSSTTGTLTIKVQKSTDGGATWSTIHGPSVGIPPSMKKAQATFIKDTYAFEAGDLLRATITTMDFAPTANNCDVVIEVEL